MSNPPKIRVVILDPGHGLGNRRAGVFDPGAVSNGVREADIVMDWTNEIRAFLLAAGYRVVRTRANQQDPASVGERADIARRFKGDVMLSIHCNAFNGKASGTETLYRGEANRAKAAAINKAVVEALGTVNRGAKLESVSPHGRLAVMSFQPCFLVELGFIDHPGDRAKMLDPKLRTQACEALARAIVE